MMQSSNNLILGEFRRTVDDRFRLSIPLELVEKWPDSGDPTSPNESLGVDARSETADRDQAPSVAVDRHDYMLAKERPGCVSLWRGGDWQEHLAAGIRVVQSKLEAGRLGDRLAQVQTLGRLLSTRQRPVRLAGRGRLVIPEGFREFLGVDPGAEVLVIGAAVCVEIWQPDAWKDCLNDDIPRFGSLLDDLSR